jgi:hypothetical protein
MRESSVTEIELARIESASMTKVLIPTPPQFGTVLIDQSLDLVQLRTAKSNTPLKPHGVEPELGLGIVPLHMM